MSVEEYDDPDAAFAALATLYNEESRRIREGFAAFANDDVVRNRVRGFYPFIRFTIDQGDLVRVAQSYGFCDVPGRYETTITRPDLFRRYVLQQLTELHTNHACRFEIGLSTIPIPVHFAFPDGLHVERGLNSEQVKRFQELFDSPDLALFDDELVNGVVDLPTGATRPLSHFSAPRIDYSLHRIRHYTGTECHHFQNFVLFTNYQFYVDGFRKCAQELVAESSSGYVDFVEPDSSVHSPQMPAYHLKRDNLDGITMVNIGVGPSNAKTITDHIAVLRPSAWIMLGHCAGLRRTQRLGDYVLAHGYVRDDHVLDADLPLWVPIPALAEIQTSLEQAVAEIVGLDRTALKQVMRTGTVASVDNRNWELRDQAETVRRLSQSRAIALDMESATVAANGFRFRVPYGTLLVVSDRPLHGELKLPGMASEFYRTQVDRHLEIGIRALSILRELPTERLHSRKLRSFNEVPFQ
ncbi:MAG: AMP nucleosidase [Hyphomicrobiaceae bacterium]